MSMEMPVLATNWSGNTEFMTEDNSYPIQIKGECCGRCRGATAQLILCVGLSVVGEGAFATHQWADVDVDHLIR